MADVTVKRITSQETGLVQVTWSLLAKEAMRVPLSDHRIYEDGVMLVEACAFHATLWRFCGRNSYNGDHLGEECSPHSPSVADRRTVAAAACLSDGR